MDVLKHQFVGLADALQSFQWDAIVTNKALAVALGLQTHFIVAQGEVDFHMHLLIVFLAVSFLALIGLLVSTSSVATVGEAVVHVSTAYAVYLAALYTSIFVYRAFFHRLRNFPGPFLARVTSFYSVSLAARRVRCFEEVEKLHKQYGDYFRFGPRELSIADVEAIPVVHGPNSKCTKGVWYSMSSHIEGYSMHMTRDKKLHKDRRRIWDRAFNAKALRDYEPHIDHHSAVLLRQLEKRTGENVRFSNWVNFYSFDAIGDIGFSRSFGMLEKGTEDEVIRKLHLSMLPLGIFRSIVWLLSLMLRVPVFQRDLNEFIQWTVGVLNDRKKITPKHSDIFSWLIDPIDKEVPMNLNADTRLLIVAGSDTTAATLTWLMYELLTDRPQLAKLQKAIDESFGDKTLLSCEELSNHATLTPLLDAFINETLRLHPAVPSGVQRETPSEGIKVGDKDIPGNVFIWMPTHTIQRDARYFKEPLRFYPERWLEPNASEWILDRRAFMPFNTGPYKCIGVNLAMMEIRSVIANVLHKFDVRPAEGEDFHAIENDTKDTFTLTMGKLDVVLSKRK